MIPPTESADELRDESPAQQTFAESLHRLQTAVLESTGPLSDLARRTLFDLERRLLHYPDWPPWPKPWDDPGTIVLMEMLKVVVEMRKRKRLDTIQKITPEQHLIFQANFEFEGYIEPYIQSKAAKLFATQIDSEERIPHLSTHVKNLLLEHGFTNMFQPCLEPRAALLDIRGFGTKAIRVLERAASEISGLEIEWRR